jgi:heme/copper-type cytochrome/quinol oxidase subunit 2
MNKYLIIGIVTVVVIGGGIFYRTTLLSEERAPVVTGVVREVTVIANKNEWRFVPEEVEINRGDHVVMTVINEDDYDHGLAIDAYGVSQRMPANSTIKVEFDATQPGDFPFYCSVPCGEGDAVIDGKTVHRTHFDMIGKLHVRSLISETR